MDQNVVYAKHDDLNETFVASIVHVFRSFFSLEIRGTLAVSRQSLLFKNERTLHQ
jgi:hypothetical protein